MNRSLLGCVGVALALALPLGAAGGDAPAAPASYGETVEVVGERRRTAGADPTAAATLVDASRFAGEARTVAELVATAPGVAVSQYGGLGQLATVSIRGSSAAQVQVFLDGVPLNTGAGGGVDLSRIPRAWIDRLEVVRGADGAVYGQGTLGGAVNVITRPAAAGAWSLEASGGSFRTFAASADGAAGGARWGLLGAAAVEGTGGQFEYLFDPTPAVGGDALEPRQRTHDASLSGGGLAKAWASLGAGELDAVLQLSGGKRDLPGSPYHLTPDDGQDDFRAGLVARYAVPLGDALELVASVAGRDDRLVVRIAPFPEARQRDVAADASAELRWTAGPSRLSVKAAVRGERLATEGAEDHARAGVTLALSDDLVLAAGDLRLTPALRWDREGAFQGLSAKLGASLRLVGPLSARAALGRAFRLPSFAELYLSQGALAPNPDLVPETSWSADAGLAAEGRLGLAALTAFTQDYRDVIVYEPDSFRRLKPFNDGKAAARGLELEVASAPVGPAGLSATAAYAWLATETLRGDEAVLGKDLPHRARHRLYARLSAEAGPLAGHADAQYVSSQYQDLRNSPGLLVPPVLTFGAGVSWRVWRRPEARLTAEIRNLLDDRTLQDGYGNPLPGRMVTITLRVTGGKDPT